MRAAHIVSHCEGDEDKDWFELWFEGTEAEEEALIRLSYKDVCNLLSQLAGLKGAHKHKKPSSRTYATETCGWVRSPKGSLWHRDKKITISVFRRGPYYLWSLALKDRIVYSPDTFPTEAEAALDLLNAASGIVSEGTISYLRLTLDKQSISSESDNSPNENSSPESAREGLAPVETGGHRGV